MTLERDAIEQRIDRAADTVGAVWPLHSFVTANPLAGFEDRPFHEAVAEAEELFGGRGYPHPSVFRRAWEDGRIDPDVLTDELEAHGISRAPEALLEEMESDGTTPSHAIDDTTERVDRVLSKWLTAFLDEGRATWSMPNRDQGFYAAWRELATHDSDVPGVEKPSDLPEAPLAALESVVTEYPEPLWETIFEHHLASLPGWTGFIKQRVEAPVSPWQEAHPISLVEYLAVRLTLADLLDAPIVPEDHASNVAIEDVPLPEIWLTAWEKSYRNRLVDGIDRTVSEGGETDGEAAEMDADDRPAAQLVFCIDTRSEIIRRHIEAAGSYETHGYAGFFGIPMRHAPYDEKFEVDACPPIVEPEHHIVDQPCSNAESETSRHDRWSEAVTAARKHLKNLKTNVAAAFTFVEGGGSAYGAALAARTLLPSVVADASKAVDEHVPSPGEFCTPTVDQDAVDQEADDHGAFDADTELQQGMTLAEKVEYAATAFELMGWEEFARLVVFTGHASETTNNPFASSLDCGACAGNPGGPNARVLATICNDDAVRAALREQGFEVPSDTVFVAAEHNTTTDEIRLFDSDVPESHADDLDRLREDLERAGETAASERMTSMPDTSSQSGARDAERRSADWAETRPEWGLAGNASFIIGPRELTAGENLDGRAFLHSYDWTTDSDGEALESIMTGPLVVTQWINSQYYFATVDDAVYGSGSKVTQNPRGNVGVVQGNGGDLMRGLPRQSLMIADGRPYHQPLRLTAVIHAPVDRVTEILHEHEEVAELFDNGWLSLTVIHPEQDGAVFHYQGDLEWEPTVRASVKH